MGKRIVIIHGRATKPREQEKYRLVVEALAHGLARVSDTAANKVRNGRIPIELAYYGDVNNALLWAAGQRPPRKFVADFLTAWKFPYEVDGSYDESLAKLFARPTAAQNEKEFFRLRREVRDLGLVDNILDVVSPLANLTGLNDELLNRFLPDLGAYFEYRVVGSMIRQRLQKILVPLLAKGHDVCLVSHSMGTIVAYDVLWKLSRMSEYEHVRHRKVSLFVTLGSPLGDPVVAKQLYDSNEPEDGRYPANIAAWENFSAQDDFIARDEELADNFAAMKQRKLLARLNDHFIHTFWVGRDGLNPHKLYGYLDHQRVARAIARWIEA
jgi:hypothetical protein